ncbi:MAG: oxidoreductase [Deltaproteobacteria bacterium]|nr:oxidoreductase [Deltaproteobacteria bacterium]
MSLALAIAAVLLTASSGALSVAFRRQPDRAQRLAAGALVLGALLGMAGAGMALASPVPPSLDVGWQAPFARFAVRLDALSALFLFPVLGVPAAGAVYGLGYFPQARHGARAVRLQIWFGLVTGSMALVCMAANAILFLLAWEVMALAAFLLVLTDHEEPEAQRAAFVYLASAHVGNLALFALFVLLAREAGSWDFARMAGLAATTPAAPWLFGLALGGFGLKAGLMPLHFWLPGAHAAAPSHVSALMSGVLLKTGVYGLLRVTGFFEAPPASWGMALFTVGAVSGVLGVAFALAQHDLKRLLAYHSVENVGIIAMGAGLALLGRARGDGALVLLGLSGAVLHTVNHATFKALLFLGAGAVVHATQTRDLDHLGGLARAMPRTAALFLVGAAAISGLPPLNGFVSEWLVALASVRTAFDLGALPHPHAAALGVPVLALIGGLAAACFAKVVGAVFLGNGRSPHAALGHEPPPSMLAPMAALAAVCFAIGLLPALVIPSLTRAAAQWARLPEAALAAPAAEAARSAARLSAVAAVLLLLVAVLVLWRRRSLGARQPAAETWGCGFTAPTPRMQYTGSSLAEALVIRFGWVFFPRARVIPPAGLFPRRAAFSSSVPDTVLDVGILPALGSLARLAGFSRAALVGGRVQFQALLLLCGLIGLLAWLYASG